MTSERYDGRRTVRFVDDSKVKEDLGTVEVVDSKIEEIVIMITTLLFLERQKSKTLDQRQG